MNRVALYVVLQIADLVSTLVFLSLGVQEGNPLVAFFMRVTTPLIGLLIVKAAALALGLFYVSTGRSLTKINVFFIVLFMWNLLAIHVAK